MKHFTLQELVDRATFQQWGEGAWNLLSNDLKFSLDGVRDFFGVPVTVNNWFGGGPFQYRGYRSPECKIGAPQSQHRVGNAADFDIKGMNAEEARTTIKNHQDDPRLIKITRMELDVSWVHIDCRDLTAHQSRIYLFKG